MKMPFLKNVETQLSQESKEMIQQCAEAQKMQYGKISFVLQAGKVIDVIIEKRVRL